MAHANGKVILLGEHAVVYGYPAIAAGIQNGAEAQAERSREPYLEMGQARVQPGKQQVGLALRALLGVFGSPSVAIRAALNLPAGCGLGASAALGVAIARSVSEVLADGVANTSFDDSVALSAALAWEKVFHGNPSGVDTAVAHLGGCIEFTRRAGPRRLQLHRDIHLAIGIAGPPASTKKMVDSLAARRHANPEFVDECLRQVGELARHGRGALTDGDWPRLGSLMDQNHDLLLQLGLSTPGLDRACELARQSGALGAKLTGAGGGGCVIALPGEDASRILDTWSREDTSGFLVTISATAEGDDS